MTVLVLGSEGWLGSHYVNYFASRAQTYGCGRYTCDITSLEQVRTTIAIIRPNVVINCAGKTHSATIPNIDGCIESPKARNETVLSNVVGAGNVAQACTERGVKLIHIGSGCIFNGYEQVYAEDSKPNPPSFYAQTKLDGDREVLQKNPNALILRIRMPISCYPHPRNLITKLANAEQVIDVRNTVTVVEDLLSYTESCLYSRGIIHAVQPQPLSFRDLMKWYCERVDPKWDGQFIPASEYKTKDGRSNAIVISNRQIWMAPTEQVVKMTLDRYAHHV